MEPWGLRPKKFQTSVAVPPAPVRVPSQRSLASSVTSVVNDDNEMILGLCTDLLAFALQLRKTSARRPSDKGVVRAVIVSNGAAFLQMRSVGSHSTSGREKEGIKERKGWGKFELIYKLKSK